MITIASSLFECKRAPAKSQPSNLTLETSHNPFIQQIFETAENTRTRLSVDRAVDWPFHRSTGRSTRCSTESWVTSVGRPDGRPNYFLVHVVHIGRPGRSTELLLVRAVDRAGRPHFCSCCCCAVLSLYLPSSFVVDFLGDHSTTPRRSLSTFSAILLSFQHYICL